MIVLRQLINGLHVGSIYALIALGYTMVYGIVKLINFAHGDIIMVGSYVAMVLMAQAGLPFWAAMAASMALCGILGVTMERVAYKPLRSLPRINSLITAIGVSLLLQNTSQLIFSPNPQPFPTAFKVPPVSIGGLDIGFITLFTIVVSVGLMLALQAFVRATKMGKAMRAVSEDMGAAQLMGINVNTTVSVTFAIGSVLAAIGAVLYSSAYPSIAPTMGSLPGLKAFIAAVLGGIGVLPGAMLGGFIMGVAESLTKGFISSQLADAVVYGILIVVLLVKPSGILGRRTNEKV
ncbi:MAG: branched-chain amino acid ABC transporter permease [Oscillospiraceae bacterium]|jgi:branched-chain amino acid transport system permease protein|nr:branched-chain amino acid ABC transporter permease [Oscillospiraceae bacterium]